VIPAGYLPSLLRDSLRFTWYIVANDVPISCLRYPNRSHYTVDIHTWLSTSFRYILRGALIRSSGDHPPPDQVLIEVGPCWTASFPLLLDIPGHTAALRQGKSQLSAK
jgi:hypothetical protein